MKLLYPLIVAAVTSTVACSNMPRVGTTARAPGGPVSVWVYDGSISVGEEPIHRKASDHAPILFQLDRDGEAGDYRFRDPPVTVTQSTTQFDCRFQNDNMAKCAHPGDLADKYKYTLYLVNRNTGKEISVDPFIITH